MLIFSLFLPLYIATFVRRFFSFSYTKTGKTGYASKIFFNSYFLTVLQDFPAFLFLMQVLHFMPFFHSKTVLPIALPKI
jgi:hypothetical protein